MNQELTSLEQAIIRLTAEENWPQFRDASVRVIRRENTGAGRFTYLDDGLGQELTDGVYSAQGRFVELPLVPNGLAFEVAVTDSRIAYIELAVYGNVAWDGSENGWRIA